MSTASIYPNKPKSSLNPKANISDRTEETGQSLFVYIDEWGGDRLFIYLLILLVIIWVMSKHNVTLGFAVALGIAYFVISYMNHRSKTMADTQQDIVNIKESHITPKPKETTLEQDDVRNFLFSVQDLRVYNAQAYEEMVKKTDNFFEFYAITFAEPSRAYIYYGLMEQAKRDALNALSSLVFIIPEDRRVRGKLTRATTVMDEIMTKYLDQVSYVADEYRHKHGWNTETKVLNYGPKPFNQYDDIFQPYSYEVY
jgi:hypothetical protein